jgi:hypothetical protein
MPGISDYLIQTAGRFRERIILNAVTNFRVRIDAVAVPRPRCGMGFERGFAAIFIFFEKKGRVEDSQ